MGEGEKCEVHELMMGQMVKEIDSLKVRVTNLEQGHHNLETFNARIEENFKNYGTRFTKIELSLDGISSEIKGISEKIIYIAAKNESQEKEEKTEITNESLLKSMITDNNKILWITILVLGTSLLVSLGVKVEDILKIFGL